ncbi:MAG: TA system VapC family ribonuclease toxin [Acidobacteriota bacterium]
MIAVDTNILVHAHRAESEWHARAKARVAELAGSDETWAIPWPCVHEFLAVVTHPRIFRPPTPMERALQQVSFWMESPSLALLDEGSGYWDALSSLIRAGGVTGPRIHDARIAALCVLHGVKELWSADRDFGRFRGLKVRNPLVG